MPIDISLAAPSGTEFKYTIVEESRDHKYGGLLFSIDKSKNTSPIDITAPSGKVIKSLKIYDKDGKEIDNVTGFTRGMKNFTGTQTFEGTRVKVRSLKNGHYGTIYYWDRRSGSHNWRATNEQFTLDSDDCGRPGVPLDNYRLRKFPGCNSELMESKIPLENGFFLINGEPNSPGDFWIPNKAVSPVSGDLTVDDRPVRTRNGVKVELHNSFCTYDPTTMVFGVKNPSEIGDSLSLKYGQSFESFPYDTTGDKQYKDWAAPGARQLWYCARFEADFYSYTYMYHDKKIYVEYEDESVGKDPEIPPGGGSGSCAWTIGAPSQVSSPKTNYMSPAATGVIRADSRGSERFNILEGIPTSETLYANVFANNYLFQHTFANMSGKVNYQCKVDVTYGLIWKVKQSPICTKNGCTPQPDIPMSDSVTKQYSFTLQRDYSYWEIKNIEVYGINRSSVSNYALPRGGTVFLYPSGYSMPTLSTTHSPSPSEHVKPKDTGKISFTPPTLNGGYQRPSVPNDESALKSMAEAQTGEAGVRNDTVTFNGSTIMEGSWTSKSGSAPGSIPAPTMIGANVLYESGLLISNSLKNAANTPSNGTIYYDLVSGNVNGGSEKELPINGINTVTVHTPTVNYSNASDDAAHNQKTRPNLNRRAFILDRPFTIHIPTSGQHRNILGYGNRDYAKYIKEKQVRFEFDVYSADKSIFYPKNTWISIPVRDLATDFYLPVWVDEGDYTIHFRSFAENAPSDTLAQQDANLEVNNHVATDTVPVEVIGRVYDFRITDIVDMNWELAFRQQKKSKEHTGRYYWVGTRNIDGNPRGNDSRYTLPIRRGSHPNDGFKNVAVKPGYHFKFDLKTKGNMFGPNDSIRITPTFEFVSRDGKHRQEVDLYYHAPDRNFVRIGSSFDTIEREITLNTRLRNLYPLQIEQTGRTFYQLHRHQLSQSEQLFMQQWLRQVDRPTKTGGFSHMKVPGELRLFRGPTQLPNGVNPYRAYAAEQQWYGEFGIPSKVYVVQKGFPLHRQFSFREDASFFLKDGYIVVNFNIETIRAGRVDNPHLQYINAPLTNQWRREGFAYSVTDPYGATFQLKDGDILFYDAAQSSRDDYRVGGTH
ncbi:DUF5704 domain-containing protein [Paenibacillus agilis]|nr:DUF5704 domain-containing protein [Paenibacillus agilis]